MNGELSNEDVNSGANVTILAPVESHTCIATILFNKIVAVASPEQNEGLLDKEEKSYS